MIPFLRILGILCILGMPWMNSRPPNSFAGVVQRIDFINHINISRRSAVYRVWESLTTWNTPLLDVAVICIQSCFSLEVNPNRWVWTFFQFVGFGPTHEHISNLHRTYFLKDLFLKWPVHFTSRSFKSRSFLWHCSISHIPRKPASVKDGGASAGVEA